MQTPTVAVPLSHLKSWLLLMAIFALVFLYLVFLFWETLLYFGDTSATVELRANYKCS